MSDKSSVLGQFEDLIMGSAEGDKDALTKLIELIAATPELVPGAAALLSDSLELLVPEKQSAGIGELLGRLLLLLAARGLETMPLRDALASFSRQRYRDYPDPAGLIQALGVLDPETDIRGVPERFEMFALLKEGARVWHDSYGFGQIRELDPFSNLIYITFSPGKSGQTSGLQQALDNLNIVKPGSLAGALLDKQERFDPAIAAAEFDHLVAGSFSPPLRNPRQVVKALLVPAWLGPRGFIAWHNRQAPSTSKPVALEAPKPAGTTAEPITWKNARSLHELRLRLAGLDRLELQEQHTANLLKLYQFAGPRPNFAGDFAHTLALLYSLAADPAALERLIAQLPADACAWRDPEAFVAVTGELPAKLVESWLRVSWLVHGREWFWQNVSVLPLKYWAYIEKMLATVPVDGAELRHVVLEKLKRREATADAIVWLWRQKLPETIAAFTNPRFILEVLAKPVRGEFHQAHKTLRTLVLNKADFQRVLMDGGSPKGIENFIRVIEHSRALNAGEQQSLLVKIVRQFPEARDRIEGRSRPTPAGGGEISKMSSFRSVEFRRRELQELVNKKIPASSAAIAQARSYGDLSENFEYKAAKEAQRLLMARRRELEAALGEIQPTDFSEVVADRTALPGVSVELEVGGGTQTHHILGLWDSDPERHILSYDTPLAQAMLGKTVGDTLRMPQKTQATIVAVHELPDEIKQWLKHPE